MKFKGDTGKFDIPFVIKSPSAKATMRLAPGENHSESFTIADLEAGKEIISTQLHDNALNDFEKHFEDKGLIQVMEDTFSTSTLQPGTYIKTTSSFTAMNFEVIEKNGRRKISCNHSNWFLMNKKIKEYKKLKTTVT
ncbi:hypothetical protein ACT7DN_30015 [Bacillus paranthracis]